MEKDIGKIPKNENTSIVVRLDDFGGKRGLTIREFIETDKYTGFTKKGTRIAAEDFEKFKEMINSINPEDIKSEEGEQKKINWEAEEEKADVGEEKEETKKGVKKEVDGEKGENNQEDY